MKKLILLILVIAIAAAVIYYLAKPKSDTAATDTNTDTTGGSTIKFLKGEADFIAFTPPITLANGKSVYYKKAVSNTVTNTSEVKYYDANKNMLSLSLKDAMEISTIEKTRKMQ